MPSIDELYAEYETRGFEVVLVNMGEAPDHVRATVKKRGYRMPVVLDARGDVSAAYGVRATPTVFLVDREGRVVGRAIGMREWAGAKGRALLEALLGDGE